MEIHQTKPGPHVDLFVSSKTIPWVSPRIFLRGFPPTFKVYLLCIIFPNRFLQACESFVSLPEINKNDNEGEIDKTDQQVSENGPFVKTAYFQFYRKE